MVRKIVGLGVCAFAVLSLEAAFGQDFPNKPIRIITSSVGGGADFMARQIGGGISGPLGQPVVVDNRPTANIAAEATTKSPPDGYTLLVQGSALWLTPLLQKTAYDVTKDFTPISLVTREVLVVAVHPSVPVKSIKELIALAKARPGELNYASGQVGGPPHLAGELLKSMTGINIVLVPYKGNATAITGLVGGEVQMAIYDAGQLAPHLKAGKLRALAVTSAEPSALTPGLPTVASTVPGYEWVGMTAIFAPGNTPAPVVNHLNQEIVRFLSKPDVKERLLAAQEEILATSSAELTGVIKSDITRMTKVIKDAGIKLD